MNREDIARAALENLGCDVQKIPETTQQTPDFLVSIADEDILIELKSKELDPKELKTHEVAKDTGEVVVDSLEIMFQNAMSARVKKAVKQLSASGGSPKYRLVWLMATDGASVARFDQYAATLLGTQQMIDWNQKGGNLECYYFMDSAFYRHREWLDGAVLSRPASKGHLHLQICLNNHSPSYADLRSSAFSKAFGHGVLDPVAKAAQGLAYIVDAPIDRSDEAAVLDFVRKKYGRPNLKPIVMNDIRATSYLKQDKP